MTNQQEQVFPYYRSASAIRSEVFSHRMRGLDEEEVRDYLELLADQVQAADSERAEIRAENDRLRTQLERLRSEEAAAAESEDEINPHAVAVFSQAQLVADQLVEEAVRHARELMSQARAQQREILQRAHDAAESSRREAESRLHAESAAVSSGRRSALTDEPSRPNIVPMTPVPEVEYVKTFARVAQVQLRSVLDALAEQLDKLGEVSSNEESGRGTQVSKQDSLSIERWQTWQIDTKATNRPDPGSA